MPPGSCEKGGKARRTYPEDAELAPGGLQTLVAASLERLPDARSVAVENLSRGHWDKAMGSGDFLGGRLRRGDAAGTSPRRRRGGLRSSGPPATPHFPCPFSPIPPRFPSGHPDSRREGMIGGSGRTSAMTGGTDPERIDTPGAPAALGPCFVPPTRRNPVRGPGSTVGGLRVRGGTAAPSPLSASTHVQGRPTCLSPR